VFLMDCLDSSLISIASLSLLIWLFKGDWLAACV
jgi:hypothetical protein